MTTYSYNIEYTRCADQSEWEWWDRKKYSRYTEAKEEARRLSEKCGKENTDTPNTTFYGFRVVEEQTETTFEIITEFLVVNKA